MFERDALTKAHEQLDYWREQYIEAQANGDLEHIVLCRANIAQCEAVISTLRGTDDP